MTWRAAAECAGIAPGVFHPKLPPRGDPRGALDYCRRCPVVTQCAENSLRTRRRHGVVAGVWLSADSDAAEVLREISHGTIRRPRCAHCWRVLERDAVERSCELCGFFGISD
ncbi:WhiB family transcriptional regulator [Nocardia takedensis]|uniref:WhiB family transcriptional regulator n=1 Tax=Nocardia takedensis TaxID=259390 RepID=UPI000A0193F6